MIKQLLYPVFLSICFHGLIIGSLNGNFFNKAKLQIQESSNPEINLAFAKLEKIREVEKVTEKVVAPRIKNRIRNKTIPKRSSIPRKHISAKPPKEKTVSNQILKQASTPKAKVNKTQIATSNNYKKVLLSRLAKFKKYPRIAKRKKIEGRAILRVKIDRSGKVLESELTSSTGSELLDKATIQILNRASPLPPMPENIEANVFQFFVPVEFKLV